MSEVTGRDGETVKSSGVLSGNAAVKHSGVTSDSTVAALGERALVSGYALAGVVVLAAEDAEAVRSAWRALNPDIAVVILTPAAAAALGPELSGEQPLTVVLPP